MEEIDEGNLEMGTDQRDAGTMWDSEVSLAGHNYGAKDNCEGDDKRVCAISAFLCVDESGKLREYILGGELERAVQRVEH